MTDVRPRAWTWEHGGYLLALTLALTLRLVALGRWPLGDAEADLAWRAWQLSRGQAATLGSAPLYTLWTAAVFFLFGATDFTARLIPALVGGMVVLLPWGWRRFLGREVALALAWALALDPALVAAGRTAGGTALAVTLALAAGTWALHRAWGGALALAGLALLAGRITWVGILGWALALGAGMIWRAQRGETSRWPFHSGQALTSQAWLTGGLVWLLAVTLFGAIPAGIGQIATGWVDFLRGWVGPTGTPWWVPPLAEGLAAPWAWLFVLVALSLWPRWQEAGWAWVPGAALWLGGALLAAILYPGRTALAMAWAAVPLWALAVGAAVTTLRQRVTWSVWAHAAALLALAAYLWLTWGTGWWTMAPLMTPAPWMRWALVGLDVGLMVALTALVALSHSLDRALRGALWGLGAALALLTVRGTAQVIWALPERTLWLARPASLEVRLLQKTLAQAGEWAHGRPDTLEVMAVSPSPTLRWALHGIQTVQVQDLLAASDLPEALLTPEEGPHPAQGAAYRGQDFAVTMLPWWVVIHGEDWVRWYTLGETPRPGERVILWIRADVFPGGKTADFDIEGEWKSP